MERIVVFGNSGSGKSTISKRLSDSQGLPHMDLDSIAWEMGSNPPKGRASTLSQLEIDKFVEGNENWIIEGCYSDLLRHAMVSATKVIFLNPGINVCIENARSRPWESHKYDSPEAQNANLDMLISWIRQYDQREDEFSLVTHRNLFDSFSGDKCEYD